MLISSPSTQSQNRNPYLAIIIALAIISAFFGIKYFTTRTELIKTKTALDSKLFNEKIVLFNRTFIEKVLRSTSEVSFEDRLRLENAVRDLNDKEILDRWNLFVASKTETEAQENVKELLSLLARKIKI